MVEKDFFTDEQKKILIKVAQALKSYPGDLYGAWESRVSAPTGEAIRLRRSHLRKFVAYIGAGDFKAWEHELYETARSLRKKKISLTLGHSLSFCESSRCLDYLMREFPKRRQWNGIFGALECFNLYNLSLVYNGFAAKNGQNGFRDVPPTRDLLCRLTSREQEVVNLVVEGLSSKAAAARLGISVKTVEAHRANIMRKLSINNVAQLVRYVYRGELPSG